MMGSVLYVDIDIHHGDGVEEAFYLTDRCVPCPCVGTFAVDKSCLGLSWLCMWQSPAQDLPCCAFSGTCSAVTTCSASPLAR